MAAANGHGAFHGWKALICHAEPVVAGFKRLLLAGGAAIVHDSPPFTRAAEATHAFVDLKAARACHLDVAALEAAGVRTWFPNYIADYLTEGPDGAFDHHVYPVAAEVAAADNTHSGANGGSSRGSRRTTPRKRLASEPAEPVVGVAAPPSGGDGGSARKRSSARTPTKS